MKLTVTPFQIGAMDGTLSKSDLGTRLYTLAAIYCYISERRRAARDQDFADLKGLFTDLKIRLETSFELTSDQRASPWSTIAPCRSSCPLQTNIHKLANDLIFQPQRTVFGTLNVDVYVSDIPKGLPNMKDNTYSPEICEGTC